MKLERFENQPTHGLLYKVHENIENAICSVCKEPYKPDDVVAFYLIDDMKCPSGLPSFSALHADCEKKL
jgi:hypothetical protein